MAAYAALVSLMHIIENLEHHPCPPISLHKEQVESLTAKVDFLLEFLQGYNPSLGYSTEADPLEIRIADAAYAAEDVIESHIVDQITNNGENISCNGLYEAVEKVIEEMASIGEEAVQIKGRVRVQRNSTLPGSSKPSSSIAQKGSMVGADDVLHDLKDKLTSRCIDLLIIPVVGMGGAGKTTVAMNIYQEGLIKERFDIRVWATISQEHSIREILVEILSQLNCGVSRGSSENELGDKIYKHLYGRRYLIIMDDMWSMGAWDKVRIFFPDNKNGSRIVVTTRLSNLAYDLTCSKSLIKMGLLDEANSWDLLSTIVFGEKGRCPLELKEIGEEIAVGCRGLPLSIVVVGGLLAKSEHTREFWKYIKGNLNSIVNLEDDECCLKILHMSYRELPLNLKPCFLYMGSFPEDHAIPISKLIKLWVAEGFLKPISGKSLEEIARQHVKELTDRNLVLIHMVGISGNIKQYKIHDLLRDLCWREAQKERFYTVVQGPHQGIGNAAQRRIVIPLSTSKNDAVNALSSMPLARSLMWHLNKSSLPTLGLRLLRILDSRRIVHQGYPELPVNLHELVNARYLIISDSSTEGFNFPTSSASRFWNLQTLMAMDFSLAGFTGPMDIWCMPHIRHVQTNDLHLPDPPTNGEVDIVLENLQTLSRVRNFKFSEQVVRRIPNISKLKIFNVAELDDHGYCLDNLGRLHKLKSLACTFLARNTVSRPASLLSLINFPCSLGKLSLHMSTNLCWEEILDKIGSLPLLLKLILRQGRFNEGQWKTSEGQFPSLKFLLIDNCGHFQVWTAESAHFPCLEYLLLHHLKELEEIPLDFAEISTLKVMEMDFCSISAVESAKRILEEQEELYGEEEALQVQVRACYSFKEALESLATPHFCFKWEKVGMGFRTDG